MELVPNSFGWAMEQMASLEFDQCVQRLPWHDKWVGLQSPDKRTTPHLFYMEIKINNGDEEIYERHPWMPSGEDLLALDWDIA